MTEYSSYNVPEFSPLPAKPTTFRWWSWHPTSFSSWTPSCWKYPSKEEALECAQKFEVYGMHYYHNKLIKESVEGFEEVADFPCQRTDLWDKCIQTKKEIQVTN